MGSDMITVGKVENTDALERRVEEWIRGGPGAVAAMQELRGRGDWREHHESFEAYTLARFGLASNHTKRLLALKLPERLEQQDIWTSRCGGPPALEAPTRPLTPREEIEEARQRGGNAAVAELVRQREQAIRDRAERARRGEEAKRREEMAGTFHSRLRSCIKLAGYLDWDPSVAERLRAVQELTKDMA